MERCVSLGAVTHIHTGNLFNKGRKHKDMKYLCDFVACKII